MITITGTILGSRLKKFNKKDGQEVYYKEFDILDVHNDISVVRVVKTYDLTLNYEKSDDVSIDVFINGFITKSGSVGINLLASKKTQ